jgi:hypothetical protein
MHLMYTRALDDERTKSKLVWIIRVYENQFRELLDRGDQSNGSLCPNSAQGA